jgi:O-antigen/teichoic acid export membrane protein
MVCIASDLAMHSSQVAIGVKSYMSLRRFGRSIARRSGSLCQIALLWAGSVCAAGIAFLTQLALAHHLGPSSYGAFASALALVTILAPLVGFGLQGFWLKAFGQEGWAARRWLPGSYRFLVVSGGVVVCLFIAWCVVGPNDVGSARILLLMSPSLLGLSAIELTASKLQLEDKYAYLSLWQVLPNACRFLLVAVGILIGGSRFDGQDIALIYSLVSLIVTVVTIAQIGQMSSTQFDLKGHGIRLGCPSGGAAPSAYEVVLQAWPFGLAGVFYLIYYQSNIVLLKYLGGDEMAGAYGVAFNVMNAIYLLPIVLYQKFLLARMHRWSRQDRARLLMAMKSGALVMLVAGAFAAIALWLSAPYLIALLFGQRYRLAADLLRILALGVPLRFLSTSIGAVLATNDHMRYRVMLMGVSALVSLVMSLLLMPAYGATGSAIATVITEMSLLGMFAFGVHARRQRIFQDADATPGAI